MDDDWGYPHFRKCPNSGLSTKDPGNMESSWDFELISYSPVDANSLLRVLGGYSELVHRFINERGSGWKSTNRNQEMMGFHGDFMGDFMATKWSLDGHRMSDIHILFWECNCHSVGLQWDSTNGNIGEFIRNMLRISCGFNEDIMRISWEYHGDGSW